MDFDIQDVIVPLVAFLIPAIGLLIREIHYRRKAKRLATEDAVSTLNQKRALIESLISKADDSKDRNNLIAQLDEVNAALLGLYGERLRHTLKEAGLPPEEILIEDGRRQLEPKQVADIMGLIEVVKTLPAFLSTKDLLVLGNAYYYMEQYRDAKKIYDRILNLNPDDPHTLNSRALTYGKLGRREEALADYNRALELKPNHPTILMNRGVTYYDLKRYEEALADYNHSLQIRPDDAMTLNNRGATYTRLGKREDALIDYNRALEIEEHPHGLFNRGVTYKYLKRYADAANDFNRVLELNPTDSDTLYELGCLFSLWGKTNDALDYLEKAISKDKKYREDAKTDKDFDSIRDDPRFKKLIESD